MGKSICFTGHRRISPRRLPTMLKELQQILEDAISNGFVDFYTGGAVGWDTYCAQMVLDMREEYPGIALHLLLPCPEIEQTSHWTREQKVAFYGICASADSKTILEPHYNDSCMQLRNQRLVDLADCCISYCAHPKARSGTAQTLRMAEKKGIPVINLAKLCGRPKHDK